MSFRTILQWTLGAHLFVVAMAYFIPTKPTPSPPKPMRSVTVQLKPAPAPKKTAPPAPQPAPKKSGKKKAQKKVPKPKQTAAPKKATAPRQAPPQKQAPSQKQAPPQPVPLDYQHLLITRLKEQLELPEIGSVEIKITFGKNGAIAKVDVLTSQSAANSRYLVSAIKKIELPPLPRNLRGNCEPLTIEFSSTGS